MVDIDLALRLRNHIGRAAQQAEDDLDDVADAARGAQEESSGLADTFRDLGTVFSVGALATAVVGRSRELEQLADAARLSVTEFQQLEFIANSVGVQADDLSDVFREMQLRLAEASSLGTGPAVDALKLLGIELADLQGLDAPDTFAKLRDAISRVEDPARRLFVAEELLGGSAERLNRLLDLQADAYDDVAEAAENAVKAHENNTNAINRLLGQGVNLLNQGLSELINTTGRYIRFFAGEGTDNVEGATIAARLAIGGYTGDLANVVTAQDLARDSTSDFSDQLDFLRMAAGNTSTALGQLAIDAFNAYTNLSVTQRAIQDAALGVGGPLGEVGAFNARGQLVTPSQISAAVVNPVTRRTGIGGPSGESEEARAIREEAEKDRQREIEEFNALVEIEEEKEEAERQARIDLRRQNRELAQFARDTKIEIMEANRLLMEQLAEQRRANQRSILEGGGQTTAALANLAAQEGVSNIFATSAFANTSLAVNVRIGERDFDEAVATATVNNTERGDTG